jgi:23S rRNA (adenine2503-C2)-methyltransferase
MASMRRGLHLLPDILPGPKAALAARFVCGGDLPTNARFHDAGLDLSAAELQRFESWLADGLATRVLSQQRGRDGTVKLLLHLHDGRSVETVAMPVGAVCVSTQVGCAVGCRFCASGLYGVERNLDTEEIVEQVVHARRTMKIERVVYMGMGEPSHNLDNVLAAVEQLRTQAGIGPRRQTLSTVGSVKTFERMAAAPVRPALALSLHLADDARRRELLPRAHKDPVADIVAAAHAYGRAVGTPVQFEWTLLAGVNDSDADVDALIDLVKGTWGYVNFIVWNPVAGLPFAAPPRERIVAMVKRVKEAGILAKIRDSAGPDVDAACGQLRLRKLG